MHVWCLWHLQTTSVCCPIDYRTIWFCYKTLLKHLKDSDVLPHVKMFLYYYRFFIVGTLNGISIFSQLLMVQAHDDKVKSHSFHFHTERSRNQKHFPSSLPKWFPREAVHSVYNQSSCILWRHSCLTMQDLLPLEFFNFSNFLRWFFYWTEKMSKGQKVWYFSFLIVQLYSNG